MPRGQICGLLGPNGAGKTTLFRLLMGILKANEGSLQIEGLDRFEERVRLKRLVGYLPDEPVFYSYLSGQEVLELSAAMHGLDADAALLRLRPLIERLEMREAMGQFADDYSRGMKKKLGILLALLHQPRLLILDEPTNGLDVEATQLCFELLREQASLGRTVLFSTHLMARRAQWQTVVQRLFLKLENGTDDQKAFAKESRKPFEMLEDETEPEKAVTDEEQKPGSDLRHDFARDDQRNSELRKAFWSEAQRRANLLGSLVKDEDAGLWDQYVRFGSAGFVRQSEIASDLGAIRRAPPLAQLCGTIVFLWWLVMVVMQGEGLELDVQRRRHPMWEWLLSHPVRPEAPFLAELVSPLVANPVYYTAPVYWIVLFVHVFPFPVALGAGIAVGLFFAVAAACLNKTLELCAMLKVSVPSRGAVLGLMSWLGYALLIVPFFLTGNPGILTALATRLAPLAAVFIRMFSVGCSEIGLATPPRFPSPFSLPSLLPAPSSSSVRSSQNGALPPASRGVLRARREARASSISRGIRASDASRSIARNCLGFCATAARSSKPCSSL